MDRIDYGDYHERLANSLIDAKKRRTEVEGDIYRTVIQGRSEEDVVSRRYGMPHVSWYAALT